MSIPNLQTEKNNISHQKLHILDFSQPYYVVQN